MSGDAERAMKLLSGSYISVRKLADAITAAVLSTDRGPLLARMEQGQLVIVDWDGKQVAVIAAERST